MFRAVEKVREQERQHLHEWAEDIKEKHRVEKKALEERVAILEAEKASGVRSPTSASHGGDGVASTPSTTTGASTTSSAGSAATTAVTSGPATSGDSTVASTSPLISLATTATTTTMTPNYSYRYTQHRCYSHRCVWCLSPCYCDHWWSRYYSDLSHDWN